MTAVLGKAKAAAHEKESGSIHDLEQWGKQLARREQSLSLLLRLKTMADRPPSSCQPQTAAYVEEGLKILGFDELSNLVRIDLGRTLKLFNDHLVRRDLDQKCAIEQVRKHRKREQLLREMADSIERSV